MRPLEGCRVLDLGIITAGAATSALLADLGAEVIKIESEAYKDPFRLWNSEPAPADGGDLPSFFRMTNRGKRSVDLNLKHPRGREAFLRLVANSDVVVENFSRGVLTRLGIDFPALQAVRPGIILASISSQGESGPDAGYASFGSTLEAVSGMAWMTGYGGDAPVVSGIELNYPDQVVALFAAGMIITAWRARLAGGAGVHLDLAQRELTSFLIGDAFAGGAVSRQGNAQAPYAVQDCFRCADAAWIAVSLEARQAPKLAVLLGCDTAAAAAELTTAMASWAETLSAADGIAALRAAGIVAGPVHDAAAVLGEMDRSWQWAMRRLEDGRLVKGVPFQFDEEPLAVTLPARQLGADTEAVLADIGGLSAEAIAALIVDGIAGVAK